MRQGGVPDQETEIQNTISGAVRLRESLQAASHVESNGLGLSVLPSDCKFAASKA